MKTFGQTKNVSKHQMSVLICFSITVESLECLSQACTNDNDKCLQNILFTEQFCLVARLVVVEIHV